MLMSDWEDLLNNDKFKPVHNALRASITLLEKYYWRADDTHVYFISHSLYASNYCWVDHLYFD